MRFDYWPHLIEWTQKEACQPPAGEGSCSV